MPEVVTVSSITKIENLKINIGNYFERRRYDEITQSIGMHSILIDPVHALSDQKSLYRLVLDLLKKRIQTSRGKEYAAWYARFPQTMSELMASGQTITDPMAAAVIADHHKAYGPFKSVDDFFFWALDDRRLPLDQIVRYIEKTAGIGAA